MWNVEQARAMIFRTRLMWHSEMHVGMLLLQVFKSSSNIL